MTECGKVLANRRERLGFRILMIVDSDGCCIAFVTLFALSQWLGG